MAETAEFRQRFGLMIQFLYLSKEAQPFDAPQLRALLRHSREANAAQGVTGMLLYRSGYFVQVLEGEEAQVRPVVARIARDGRHKILITEELLVGGHEFREWSMGFRDLSKTEMDGLPRFEDLSRSPASRAKRMLLGFREQEALEREEP